MNQTVRNAQQVIKLEQCSITNSELEDADYELRISRKCTTAHSLLVSVHMPLGCETTRHKEEKSSSKCTRYNFLTLQAVTAHAFSTSTREAPKERSRRHQNPFRLSRMPEVMPIQRPSFQVYATIAILGIPGPTTYPIEWPLDPLFQDAGDCWVLQQTEFRA